MPKPGGLLGDIGSELKSIGTGMAQQVKEEPGALAKKAAQQIGLEHGEQKVAQENVEKPAENPEQQVAEQKNNQDFLEALYGKSEPTPEASAEHAKKRVKQRRRGIPKISCWINARAATRKN